MGQRLLFACLSGARTAGLSKVAGKVKLGEGESYFVLIPTKIPCARLLYSPWRMEFTMSFSR